MVSSAPSVYVLAITLETEDSKPYEAGGKTEQWQSKLATVASNYIIITKTANVRTTLCSVLVINQLNAQILVL